MYLCLGGIFILFSFLLLGVEPIWPTCNQADVYVTTTFARASVIIFLIGCHVYHLLLFPFWFFVAFDYSFIPYFTQYCVVRYWSFLYWSQALIITRRSAPITGLPSPGIGPKLAEKRWSCHSPWRIAGRRGHRRASDKFAAWPPGGHWRRPQLQNGR